MGAGLEGVPFDVGELNNENRDENTDNPKQSPEIRAIEMVEYDRDCASCSDETEDWDEPN